MQSTNRRVAAAALGGALLLINPFTAATCAAFDSFDEYFFRSDSITLGHGNAVAHNIAVQTINPWPRNVGNSQIDIDGERLLTGVRRYKANRSIQPRGLPTQAITGDSLGAAPR
jgi:hypothetical protein